MNPIALQETVRSVADRLNLDEGQVQEEAERLLGTYDAGVPDDFESRLSESLGGPASSGPELGELQGRMSTMAPAGGIIGGMGAMLGQGRGQEEPHQTFQDLADEMAAPRERVEAEADRDLGSAPAPGTSDFEEIDETDLAKGEQFALDQSPDLNQLSEDDIVTGLDGADGNSLEGDETEGLARPADLGND